ncbi:MAG TPA: MerR family transcriptional regulator, partial [Rubrivivax sp.]|nr:MerR family transcriptional regulator [Rubrivivax sp.]
VASHLTDDAGELFGIAELCSEFGITLRTIRFYEDKGLLAPRRVNGARVYTRRDRARLALILRSKAIGASL